MWGQTFTMVGGGFHQLIIARIIVRAKLELSQRCGGKEPRLLLPFHVNFMDRMNQTSADGPSDPWATE